MVMLCMYAGEFVVTNILWQWIRSGSDEVLIDLVGTAVSSQNASSDPTPFLDVWARLTVHDEVWGRARNMVGLPWCCPVREGYVALLRHVPPPIAVIVVMVADAYF